MGQPETNNVTRVYSARPKRGEWQLPRRRSDADLLDMDTYQADTRKRTGSIILDQSSKGWDGDRHRHKNCYTAKITIKGQTYQYRAKKRRDCKDWLNAVLRKDILPTDRQADWLATEQHKDEQLRLDELAASAAEEACLVYEYRQTGDPSEIYEYLEKRLLPHMVWYCCRVLRMGRERTLTASRQAVGLILEKIVAGRPIANISFTCKRMLRIHRNRGDFWYYEKAPEDVRLLVNGIDYAPLADLYNITKDRRI